MNIFSDAFLLSVQFVGKKWCADFVIGESEVWFEESINMGYDIHITRKEEWSDEEGVEISLDEWRQYINSDYEMRLDGFAETELPDGALRVENEGIGVWTKWSQHEIDGRMAWFDYFEGDIRVKNPDEDILKKMYQIAQSLNAKVQGDDGEIYDVNGKAISHDEENNYDSIKKKWWQFWK